MAKSATVRKLKEPSVNIDLLKQIANGAVRFIAKTDDASALLMHNPPLIEIDLTSVNPSNNMEVACRVTAAGAALVNQLNPVNESKPTMSYEIIDNAVLPEAKRGGKGSGAPSKYPFATMNVGQSFFVAATSTMPDPVKKLGSLVSAAALRFAEDTGIKRIVERSKRGAKNKLILDENGHKIMETKEVPVLKFTKKFSIRAVKAGVTYGGWVAPGDGALIARTQ
jgi:hypothetical protein